MKAVSLRRSALLSALLTAAAFTGHFAQAQTPTTLHAFTGTDGEGPVALIQATDGNLYGATEGGGSHDGGTIYKVTTDGTLTTLYNFCPQGTYPDCANGDDPGNLIQAADGNFYGITYAGGAHGNSDIGCTAGCGTVFKITPDGTFSTLYSFCAQPNCADGGQPTGLMQGADGAFYGTAGTGGANVGVDKPGDGTIFRITSDGTYSVLHTFQGSDGANPWAGLIQAADGNFYGTTTSGGTGAGGAGGGGTVFRLTPSGTLTTLYNFCSLADCDDGRSPNALIQDAGGNFYGTTEYGGVELREVRGCGVSGDGCGTVFRLSLDGVLRIKHNFCHDFVNFGSGECLDGALPGEFHAAMFEATDGVVYATTGFGGDDSDGTVFTVTGERFHTAFSFDNTDGADPSALFQDTNGAIYGTTLAGAGNAQFGTIFSVATGLSPFVAPQTRFGAIGASVIILGTDLNGTTRVSFNGTAATFVVNSTGTAITATVPSGATTGLITVSTPEGKLTSNGKYTVTP